MTFDPNIIRDNRTVAQNYQDYKYGKQNEKLIFNLLSEPKKLNFDNDRFGYIKKYEPDCYLKRYGVWVPIEIKYTPFLRDYVELKVNQTDKLAEIKGWFLIATKEKYAFIKAFRVQAFSEWVENGYCNKPCYRYTDIDWKFWNIKINFYEKNYQRN